MKSHPFYLQPYKFPMDPSSNQDKTTEKEKSTNSVLPVLAHALQGVVKTELGIYVPPELMSNPSLRKRKHGEKSGRTSGRLVRTLDNLEAIERNRRHRLGSLGSESLVLDEGKGKDTNRATEDEEAVNDEDEHVEEEEDDEEEDYLKNYYESEVEDSYDEGDGKGDDGDAFF
jgi:hypothetical protein